MPRGGGRCLRRHHRRGAHRQRVPAVADDHQPDQRRRALLSRRRVASAYRTVDHEQRQTQHPGRRTQSGTSAEPVHQARYQDPHLRHRLGQGRRRQIVGHGESRRHVRGPGLRHRRHRRRHLRLLTASALRRAHPAHESQRHAHAGHCVGRQDDLHRHVRRFRAGHPVEGAPPATLPRAVPRRRVVGQSRRAAPRSGPGDRRYGHIRGPGVAQRGAGRGHHPAAERLRGGGPFRTGGASGADDGAWRRGEHELLRP